MAAATGIELEPQGGVGPDAGPDAPAELLAAVREQRRLADAAEATLLQHAAAWAAMHSADSLAAAATLPAVPGIEEDVPIAGPGAPLVAEFCVAELTTALGLSPDSGRRYLAHAVELRYRLPRVWGRMVSGHLRAWKARMVAERTLHLPAEAAAWVDRHLAPFAHTIGPVQLDRLTDEALTRFAPDQAEARRLAAAEHRRVHIDLDHADTSGTVAVDAVLDLADALDLETALAAGARELADLGSQETLDVRRAQALGEIARRDLTLDYHRDDTDPQAQVRRRAKRSVVLHVHLTQAALGGHDPAGRCEDTRTPVTSTQIRDWCATAAHITVRPVLDLAGCAPVEAYEIPGRHHRQVALRDHHCVFPWCTRPAARCDTDHITPHHRGGATCPCNLAPLCRRHHRLKTHGHWTYTSPRPGHHLWRSPHGYRYRVDPTGTQPLDP